jgi:hypothetical protein
MTESADRGGDPLPCSPERGSALDVVKAHDLEVADIR